MKKYMRPIPRAGETECPHCGGTGLTATNAGLRACRFCGGEGHMDSGDDGGFWTRADFFGE